MYKYYELLGVDQSADSEEIEAAFRERIRTRHPDQDGDSDAVLELKRAREVLTDPALRKDYDRLGHRQFVEREQGGTARNVDLRSTGDGRERSERKRSRSHTRPRETDATRGRADESTRRNRSPSDSGRSRNSADRTGGSERRRDSADRMPSSGPEQNRRSDASSGTDPSVSESKDTESHGGGDDQPATGQSVSDHGYDSVVDLDEVADVGSVDPDEVLNDTKSSDADGRANNSKPTDQSTTDVGTGGYEDGRSGTQSSSEDPVRPGIDRDSRSTPDDRGPTPAEPEERSRPIDDSTVDSGGDPGPTTGGNANPNTTTGGNADPNTTTGGNADPDPFGYDDADQPSEGGEEFSEPPHDHREQTESGSPANGDPLAESGSNQPAEPADGTIDDPAGTGVPDSERSDGPGPPETERNDDPGSSEIERTTGTEDPFGGMRADDPATESASDPPPGAANAPSGSEPDQQEFPEARGPADAGAANDSVGADPANDTADIGSATETADIGAANDAGDIGTATDTADVGGANDPAATGGGDPLAGPDGAEPAAPAEATSSGSTAAESENGGEAFGMAGTTETDGGKAAAPGPIRRLIGGLLALPAILVGAIPSPGISDKIESLQAVFGDEYRSDAVDQMSKYAWIGRGVIAAILWVALSVLAPDTGLVPTASPTALGVTLVSLGVAFLAYDLLLMVVAELEPGCHGPATGDAPIAGIAGFVVLYALAIGGLAAVIIDAPALVSAMAAADPNAIAAAVLDHPYHAVGGAVSGIVTVVALVALFVASLHLPWSDRFDRSYRVLPGLWQLPIPAVAVAVAWSAFTGGTIPVPFVATALDWVAFGAIAGLLPIVATIYLVRRRLESPGKNTTW